MDRQKPVDEIPAKGSAGRSSVRRGNPGENSVRKWATLGAVVFVVAALFVFGSVVRRELGIEFSLDSLADVRDWVAGLGWRGPVVFVAIVAFRGFLLLSSHLILIVGGLAFGALGGTLWGALGLLISAVVQFVAARLLGDEWVRPRLGPRGMALEERVRRVGPGMVWVVYAHPAGPLTPVNLASGLASLPLWEFSLAVALSAPIRAGACAILGTSILTWGLATSAAVGLALMIVLVAPLAIPSVRAWVLGTELPGVQETGRDGGAPPEGS